MPRNQDGQIYYRLKGEQMLNFGSLVPDGYYFKFGRTTGITVGKCCSLQVCVNWAMTSNVRWDEEKKVVDMNTVQVEG
ncbi:hypothetical protein N7495_000259 [Penicillium taxi]|uniref:uncharacterized protein n=1 Tax=Penicillium taxi TaxID=168475 RepID=UPI002544EFCC|nr:uncharacterized protein N7495_000259 [Penicillium taxi]KAJ5907577.1 hypothetical protein N7495_000259 [Penicillium taxi]